MKPMEDKDYISQLSHPLLLFKEMKCLYKKIRMVEESQPQIQNRISKLSSTYNYMLMMNQPSQIPQRKLLIKELQKLFIFYKTKFPQPLNFLASKNSYIQQKNSFEINSNYSNYMKRTEANPKYLCCCKQIRSKEELFFQNLQHKIVSLRDFKRKQLENAICAALNYERDVVVVIGLSEEMQIIGLTHNEINSSLLQQIYCKSIRPKKTDNYDEVFKVNTIPILQNDKKSGRYLISINITLTKAHKNLYHYIEVLKKGYAPAYYHYYLKKRSKKKAADNKCLPLEVTEIKEDEIYKKVHHVSKKNNQNTKIHYFKCDFRFDEIEFPPEDQSNSDSFKIFMSTDELKPLFIEKQNYTYSSYTVVKILQTDMSKREKILQKVKDQLQRLRERSQLFPLQYLKHQQYSTFKLYFILIMHDGRESVLQNIFKGQEGMEIGAIKCCQQLKLSCSNGIQKLKQKDNFFLQESKKFFDLTVKRQISQNKKSVYYSIKNESFEEETRHLLLASFFIYILIQTFGYSPVFISNKKLLKTKDLQFQKGQ